MFSDAPPTIISAKSEVPVFVFCDHATNHIPYEFEKLGLSDKDLNRHIAWDIGAATLTRQISNTFGAASLLAGFSRLLIDPNRDLNSPGLIPKISDALPIPGNQNLNQTQINVRIEQFYKPYHQALEIEFDKLTARFFDPLIVSVHSFTPQMASGEKRDLDIGLLWKVDKEKALRIKAEIESIYPYQVGLNKPYSALKLNHTIDKHIIPRGLRHITFEVKQDLIDTKAKVKKMANHLSKVLAHFIRSH
ncbi:MAG: N-formylglutamate amidohydrolase [Robiginitomaculum sp.]